MNAVSCDLILSGNCPAKVRVLLYSGDNTSSNLLDDRVFSGSVTHQLDGVRNWLNQLERKTPVRLINEMTANAIIHRDYSLPGETVLRVFFSKAQIVSLGGAVNGLSVDDIRLGISVARNAELAEKLRELGYCMLCGTGMTCLSEYYSGTNLSPRIELSPNAFFIELPFAMRRMQKLKAAVSRKKKTAGSEQKAAVIEYIRTNGSITRSAVQKLLKVGQTRALNILSAMTASGAITQSGYGKKTVYLLAADKENN